MLLEEELSTVVVGVSAALLIISVLTGLIVWWPLTGRWLQALTIKRKASSERFKVLLRPTANQMRQAEPSMLILCQVCLGEFLLRRILPHPLLLAHRITGHLVTDFGNQGCFQG